MKIAVIYGGTRENGNTELLTEHALKGLEAERVYLKDYTIRPIVDLRHSEGGFQDVDDDYTTILDRVMGCEVLIFATPIYWYGMSGFMKNFVDRWSQTLRDANRPHFRELMKAKTGYVVAVGGDQPQVKGLPLVLQFQHIFDFFGTAYGGYLLGEGNRPGEVMNDREALKRAQLWNDQFRERAGLV